MYISRLPEVTAATTYPLMTWTDNGLKFLLDVLGNNNDNHSDNLPYLASSVGPPLPIIFRLPR